MIFEELKKELKNGKRIWNVGWHQNAFIFREIFFGKFYHVAIWDNLVEFPSEPRFKGIDDRLYSTIGYFHLDRKDGSSEVIEKVLSVIVNYYGKAQYALCMIGYKIERRDLADDWEIIE